MMLGNKDGEEKKRLAVYFDMDGVLADFDEARDRVLGLSAPELNRSGDLLEGKAKELKEKLYCLIQTDPDFYFKLTPLPDGLKVFDYARRYHPIVLTAGPRFKEGVESDAFRNVQAKKFAWAKRYLALPEEDFICTTSSEKPRYLGHREADVHLLIDDREENCKAWESQGGRAIWHRSAEESLQEFVSIERELGLLAEREQPPAPGAGRGR